jgi:hypothetical protein
MDAGESVFSIRTPILKKRVTMSNWAENYLYVIGKPREVVAFVRKACGGRNRNGFELHHLMPVKRNEDPVVVWGTGLGPDPGEVLFNLTKTATGETFKDKKGRITAYVEFSTEFIGPDRWVSEVASKFPELGFVYHSADVGSDWGEEREYRQGSLARQWIGNYAEAKIKWEGEVLVFCHHCGLDFHARRIDDLEFCPLCKDKLCKNCMREKDEHADNARCLFDPKTTFEAIEAMLKCSSTKTD